jgi:uncharacterized membrane protein
VSDRVLRAALAGFGLAGVAVTAYLLSVRWGSVQLYCSTGGCETVQRSAYSELLGVPVAAAGFVAYLALTAGAFSTAPLARVGAAALALASVAFSAYLLVVQLVVIDAVCTWCVVSDVLISLAAVAAVLRLRGLVAVAPAAPYSSSSPAERA